MALREEMERQGNWLFRWRSYVPIVLVLPTIAAMYHPEFLNQTRTEPDGWGLFCLAVSLVGLAIRIAAVGHAPAGTSGRNTKEGQIASVLNSTGLYSLVRHPLYLGNFIIWIGVVMYCKLWWLTAVVALLFWVYYERIMFAEEEFLRRKFGADYEQWAANTPAFLPKLRGWKKPALPFSLRSVLRREYPGLFGIVACFFALKAYDRAILRDNWAIDPMWTGIFLAGLAVFLILRTLKRNTTLLVVEGR